MKTRLTWLLLLYVASVGAQQNFVGSWNPVAGCVPSDTCCCSVGPLVGSLDPLTSKVQLSGSTDGGTGCMSQTSLTGLFDVTDANTLQLTVPEISLSLTVTVANDVLTLASSTSSCINTFVRGTASVTSSPTQINALPPAPGPPGTSNGVWPLASKSPYAIMAAANDPVYSRLILLPSVSSVVPVTPAGPPGLPGPLGPPALPGGPAGPGAPGNPPGSPGLPPAPVPPPMGAPPGGPGSGSPPGGPGGSGSAPPPLPINVVAGLLSGNSTVLNTIKQVTDALGTVIGNSTMPSFPINVNQPPVLPVPNAVGGGNGSSSPLPGGGGGGVGGVGVPNAATPPVPTLPTLPNFPPAGSVINAIDSITAPIIPGGGILGGLGP